MPPNLSGMMVLECNHTNTEKICFGDLYDVPRCKTCGNLFMFGSWHNLPRFVLALIVSGSEARPIIDYMDKARDEDGVAYPPYTLEDYKEIAEYLAEKNLVTLFEIEQKYLEDEDEEYG